MWGPIVLARDENADASYDKPVVVKADADGFVAVKRIQTWLPKALPAR